MKKYSVATLLILVLIVLCLLMLGRVHRRLVVSINGFHQHAATITVGSGNSGICFHKIPEHFMKVTYEEGAFSWEVNPKYVKADSLCYYKVNGRNPNLHPIWDGDIFDLGGVKLEAVMNPGHTSGCCTFLDRANRRLIGGDSIQRGGMLYMFGADRDLGSPDPGI